MNERAWEAVPCKCGHQGCTSYQVPAVLPFEAHLQRDDAYLIAASPKLLEVCRLTEEHLLEIDCDCSLEGSPDSHLENCLLGNCQSAIARAEGR